MLGTLLTVFAAGPRCETKFLGLVPWYHYLKLKGDCSVDSGSFQVLGSGSSLPLILLAIIQDLLMIAGIVAVGFVIFGGITYATSQGNPDQTAKAQSSIINALVGLVISVIAVAFVSFLGRTLG